MTPTYYFVVAAAVNVYRLYSRRRRERLRLETPSYWTT